MIKRRVSAGAFVAAWAILLAGGSMLFPEDGFGRAGRGQSYRSGSSSSRSSSSSYRSYSSGRSYSGGSGSRSYSSSGSGYRHYLSAPGTVTRSSRDTTSVGGGSTTDLIIGLVFLFVLLAVFVIGVVIVVRFVRRKVRAAFQETPATAPPPADRTGEIAAIVRKDDPDFSPEAFLDRAREIFFRLQSAWSGGDMSPMRNYLSQGVYNRYRIQLEIMRDVEGVKNIMSDVTVTATGMAGLSDFGSYQTIHAILTAKAYDVTVGAAATEAEISRALKLAPVSSFTEIYSFTRKRGARTDAGKDWLKGQCPGCGFVPDNFSQVNKCPSCGSIYNSGEYDWVLSEITQPSEWHAASAADVAGLAELGAANLSMNRQVVEDRASYLFWRWIQTRVRGDSAPLARDASLTFRNEIATPSREYLGEIAVGAVDLKLIGLDGDTARSRALVLWSAASAQGASPVHHEHSLTLSMPAGLENRFGLADHGCNKCGGPLPDTDALSCAYCGSPLPEANDDWLLEHVTGG